MAIPVRGTKSSAGGGTAFVASTDILASEVNTDFDNIYNEMDNIDDDNVAASADIALTKLADTSGTDTAHATATTPGDSSSHTLPTTAEGEVQQLRYAVKRAVVGTNAKRLDGTTTTDDCFWGDRPARGPNLIRNGNFAIKTTAAGSAPDGWSLVGTPGTCTTTTTGVTEGHSTMRAIRIASAGAANEGISQTLAGLKASTRYQIGCRGKVNAGGDILGLVTTGASGATFGNLSLQTSSTSYVTLSGVILTDATPTDIVVQLLAVADGDSVDVTHVWVRECTEDPLPQSNTPWAVSTITTATPNHYADAVLTDAGVIVSIVCPGPGYVIEVHGTAATSASGSSVQAIFCLLENGVTFVDTHSFYLDSTGTRDKGTAKLFYVNTNPTPGTTYTYIIEGCGIGDTLNRNPAASAAAELVATTIRARAYLESGGH